MLIYQAGLVIKGGKQRNPLEMGLSSWENHLFIVYKIQPCLMTPEATGILKKMG
jgi:hypothetical protein